ncbi:hypothetical protein NMY22_g6609 [Coprinellus aureogranulatus]|nr:hypothetical protein NMY22_g6609 [Coprinellus aureogranulatus]
MASIERIGDTTSKLYQYIPDALLCYSERFAGGSPSKSKSDIHSAKFARETIEEIRCAPLSPGDLPLETVKEALKEVGEIPISSISVMRKPFFKQFKKRRRGPQRQNKKR